MALELSLFLVVSFSDINLIPPSSCSFLLSCQHRSEEMFVYFSITSDSTSLNTLLVISSDTLLSSDSTQTVVARYGALAFSLISLALILTLAPWGSQSLNLWPCLMSWASNTSLDRKKQYTLALPIPSTSRMPHCKKF